ncbi:MAG TPA: ATP-binding protein, partial [Hanamia sp.]|nr:ATP-binding protein [Hanamia sp.]
KKDKVFEQFYRVPGNGAPNSYPGIGLGLYIASEIIRRENGRVWVESELGKGSVFYFSLHCT